MIYFESISAEKLNNLQLCFERTEGMVSFDEAMLLYRIARGASSGSIVEVGCYRGRSSVFLGLGSIDGERVKIYSVDPHKEFVGVLGGIFGPKDRTAFYRAMLDNDCSEIVSLINLSSELFSGAWSDPISVLWIDGDHSYEGVKRDFECWLPHLQVDALIVFDDATDCSIGPFRLIEELIESGLFERVTTAGKIVVIRKC